MGLKAKTVSARSRPVARTSAPRLTPVRKASAGKTRAARKSRAGNDTVEAYLGRLGGEQRALADRLRALLREAAPAATESIKWAQPVYEDSGPFAYFRAHRGHVTLGFWRGTELADPRDLLEGDGERMKHLKLRSIAELDAEVVKAFVRDAVALNRALGNPTRPMVAGSRPEPTAPAPVIEASPSQPVPAAPSDADRKADLARERSDDAADPKMSGWADVNETD